jgi:hypothetical protein
LNEKQKEIAERLVEEAKKLAYANMGNYSQWSMKKVRGYVGKGEDRRLVERMVPVNTIEDSVILGDHLTAAVSEVSTTPKGEVRIKLHDKKGALELLMRYKGMLKDNLSLDGIPQPAPVINVVDRESAALVKDFLAQVNPPIAQDKASPPAGVQPAPAPIPDPAQPPLEGGKK